MEGRLMAITANDPFLVKTDRITRDGFIRVLRDKAAPGVIAERDPGQYYDANLQITDSRGRHVDALLLPLFAFLTAVQSVVLRSKHQLEVIKSVIGLVTVDVMNMFIGSQRTTDVLFHHIAMLKHLSTINRLPQIATALVTDTSTPLRVPFSAYFRLGFLLTCSRTESWRLVLESVFVHFKHRTAYFTGDGNLGLASLLCCPADVLGNDGRTLRPKLRVGPLLLHMRPARHSDLSWLNIQMYKPILLHWGLT